MLRAQALPFEPLGLAKASPKLRADAAVFEPSTTLTDRVPPEPEATPTLRADAVVFTPSLKSQGDPVEATPTLRADAAVFTPSPKSPGLSAEAAVFHLPIPPGLGVSSYGNSPMHSPWASSHSTALPTPWMSPWTMPSTSPWSTHESPHHSWKSVQDTITDFTFSLPDAQCEEGAFEFDLNMEEVEGGDLHSKFKLDGLDDLRDSIANFFGGILSKMTPNDDKCGDSTTTTSSLEGNGSTGESSPSTPPNLEGLDEVVVANSVDAELEETTTMAVVSSSNPSPVEDEPEDLPPLPARVRCAVKQPKSISTTTVVLHNIPKKCARDKFEEWLDEMGFLSDIDFLYVPMDMRKKCNLGQAILNFRTEEAFDRFSKKFHLVSVKKTSPGAIGNGVHTVVAAPIQGKDANVAKLIKSSLLMSMLANTPEWLPRVFGEDGLPIEFPSS